MSARKLCALCAVLVAGPAIAFGQPVYQQPAYSPAYQQPLQPPQVAARNPHVWPGPSMPVPGRPTFPPEWNYDPYTSIVPAPQRGGE